MPLLAIDIGSSSVKAAVLRGPRALSPILTAPFPTRYRPGRAEVDASQILRAVHAAITSLPPTHLSKVDAIAFSVMSPSWLAIDAKGKPLTPVITHQDRRSVDTAKDIERLIGRQRHLKITGNRPVPGGISSTTFVHFLRHHPDLMAKASLAGHLNTYLVHHLTGSRVIDPSNASFTGLYETIKQAGWSATILDALAIPKNLLPDILPADAVAGHLLPTPARALGLRDGTPVLTGIIDTSAAMLLASQSSVLGPQSSLPPGQLLNVSGTTDVLSVVTDTPTPADTHLTRALGTSGEKLWLHVSTLASAGSALTWAHSTFFQDLPDERFWPLVRKLAARPDPAGVTFAPHLAGSRTAVDQPTGAFENLSLSTSREHLLSAIIESLAAASAARLPLLQSSLPDTPLREAVITSGGTLKTLSKVLLRDWPPPSPTTDWTFHYEDQATLRGLGRLLSE